MTTPEKEHCIHECVCMGYCQTYAAVDDLPCTRIDCKHDIRSRPYNEQAIRAKVLDEYMKWDNTKWTTQRVKEYLASRQQGEPELGELG